MYRKCVVCLTTDECGPWQGSHIYRQPWRNHGQIIIIIINPCTFFFHVSSHSHPLGLGGPDAGQIPGALCVFHCICSLVYLLLVRPVSLFHSCNPSVRTPLLNRIKIPHIFWGERGGGIPVDLLGVRDSQRGRNHNPLWFSLDLMLNELPSHGLVTMPLELVYAYAIFFTLLSSLGAPASADRSHSGRAVIQGRSVEGLLPAKPRGSQEFMEEKARLGSIPPNCRNKCNACSPCEAIQVPTLPAHGRVHRAPQSPSFTVAAAATGASKKYSNYKPMGWKCKCGNHIFNP